MASTVRNQPYVSPTPGEITVVASGIVPDGTYTIDKSVFQEIRDCNFNAISLLGSTKPDMSNEVKKSICFALKHDLNILLAGYYLNLHDNGQPDLGLPKAKAYIDTYVIFVSHDVENYQTISVSFTAGVKVMEMTPTTSHGKPLTEYLATNVPHTRTLIPGGYIILDCK